MAQGVIKSEETRNHMTGLLWTNMGNLEGDMAELREDMDEAMEAIDPGIQAITEARTQFYQDLIEAGLRTVNGPNLIGQPEFTTRDYPSSDVIEETLNIPAETAAEAEETLTFTVTDENITSSYVLHGVQISDYTALSGASKVTGTFSAGSATISIEAREGAHTAMTVKVYLCTVTSVTVPYGSTARAWATNRPYIQDISAGHDYNGQNNDEITEIGVTLTGNDIVTDEDGTQYTKAVQFTVTDPPVNGWGSADKLIWNYANGRIEMENGEPKYARYGQINDMQVGKIYTMSCWARMMAANTKARLWMGCCPNQYTKVPDGYDMYNIEVDSTEWTRKAFTFTFNPTGSQFYIVTDGNKSYQVPNWLKQIGFGVCRKYAGTVQLCGFRLTEGELYLPDASKILTDKADKENPTFTGTVTLGNTSITEAQLGALLEMLNEQSN